MYDWWTYYVTPDILVDIVQWLPNPVMDESTLRCAVENLRITKRSRLMLKMYQIQCHSKKHIFPKMQLLFGKMSGWNTRHVTNMSFLFCNFDGCQYDVETWDVSNVTNMNSMFQVRSEEYKLLFNACLNQWNVSKVTNMRFMFCDCQSFNQPLDAWNVSNVRTMDSMFLRCVKFNQSLNTWKVHNVTSMQCMFQNCFVFNQSLDLWDVSRVKNMRHIFQHCFRLDQEFQHVWNCYHDDEPCSSLMFSPF